MIVLCVLGYLVLGFGTHALVLATPSAPGRSDDTFWAIVVLVTLLWPLVLVIFAAINAWAAARSETIDR